MAGKILIIDDDVTALDIIDLLFEDKGYTVIRRTDGFSALASVEEESPELVIVDLMMPNMNGQEVIQELRKRGHKVPIVAFTALDDPEVHEAVIADGCNIVLTKPCKSNELIAHIEKLIEQSSQ